MERGRPRKGSFTDLQRDPRHVALVTFESAQRILFQRTDGRKPSVANLVEFILSDGEQGECPDDFIATDHARTVARYMRCSLRSAIRLGKRDGAEFEKMLNYARVEIIVRDQRLKEATRTT